MVVEGSPQILYVEDDAGLARLVQRSLEREGYAVDLERDGDEGLRRIESKQYDVVLLDYQLPGMDGLEIIRRVGTREGHPPLIMLTGGGDESVAVEAMKLGASDYMVKDVDGGYLKLIAPVIQRVLGQSELLRQKKRWEAEREQLIIELQDALAEVRTLTGLLPICASCKKIREDGGYWTQLESFISSHSDAQFSHSLCPDCVEQLYPGMMDKIKSNTERLQWES